MPEKDKWKRIGDLAKAIARECERAMQDGDDCAAEGLHDALVTVQTLEQKCGGRGNG